MARYLHFLIRVVLMLVMIGELRAHTGFENTTEVRVFPDRMQIVIRTSYALAWKMLGDRAPASNDEAGQVMAKPLLEEKAPGLFEVTAAGIPMTPRKSKCQFELNKDVAFVLVYDRPEKWPLVLKARFFDLLDTLASGTVSVFDQTNGSLTGDVEPIAGKVLFRNDAEISVTLKPALPTAEHAAGAKPAVKPDQPGFWRFFLLGIQHILTGYDHLLFLFALLLGCCSLRPMLIIITVFTVAHSVTLALATFDIVSIPSRWVESFIALSIVYVGMDNFRKNIVESWRAWLTFAFGLIHGLGFAGLLKGIGLGANGQSVVAPLFAFNLGVETGQLAVVAVILPGLLLMRKRPGFERIWIPALSVVVVVLGGFWFAQRTFLGV